MLRPLLVLGLGIIVMGLGLQRCALLRSVETTVETTLLTHQVLVREVVRLGTRELLAFHPNVAPGIVLWADRVRATIHPTGWSLDVLESVLLGTLGVDNWTPETRVLIEEGVKNILGMVQMALAHVEPKPGQLLLTIADVATWMKEVAQERHLR